MTHRQRPQQQPLWKPLGQKLSEKKKPLGQKLSEKQSTDPAGHPGVACPTTLVDVADVTEPVRNLVLFPCFPCSPVLTIRAINLDVVNFDHRSRQRFARQGRVGPVRQLKASKNAGVGVAARTKTT